MNILAKYLRRSDPAFIDETYTLVKTYTERPRFDSRAISSCRIRSRGVTADTLAPRVIDNSIVDQLAEEKFFEKIFGKELR